MPHPRWRERPFVTAPLSDLAASMACAGASSSGDGGKYALQNRLREAAAVWESSGERHTFVSDKFWRQHPPLARAAAAMGEPACGAPKAAV